MQVHPHPLAEDDHQVPEDVQQAPEEAGQVNRPEVAEGNPQIPGGAEEAHPEGVAQARRDDEVAPVRIPEGLKNFDPVTYPEVQRFRVHRNDTIQALKASTAHLDDAAVNAIVRQDMLKLQESLQNDKLTAVAVVSAFVRRAIELDEHLNCITQMMNNPIAVAEELDRRGTKGKLFGLPFSIKSNFHVQGYPATIGLAKQLREARFPAATCSLVQHLIDEGAVPICLTNVPQGLLAYVTSNPLHGTTKNPWDFARTPGGSSGGEAALIAAGGACFGIGNDLVGSLRIPAAFCGLVSLKPTQDRLHETRMNPGPDSRGQLGLSSGFFTKTVKEQYFLLSRIVGIGVDGAGQETIDFHSRVPEGGQRKVIAYYSDDGFTPAVPSNVRAVEETIEKLGINEFEFRRVTLPELCGDPFELAELLFKNVMPDNGASMNELYFGEEKDDHMKFFTRLLNWKQSGWLNSIASSNRFQRFLKFFSTRGACLARSVNLTAQDVTDSVDKVNAVRGEWQRVWREQGYYALICPSFITPAQPFDYPAYLATGTFATGLFNMLDVPAGVVPVDPVRKTDLDQPNHSHGDTLLRWQNEAAKNSVGLPNSVQVVANNEEDCLYIMKRIEEVHEGVQKLVYNRYEGRKKIVGSGDLFERRNLRPRGEEPANNN